jgi:hypothetical protein
LQKFLFLIFDYFIHSSYIVLSLRIECSGHNRWISVNIFATILKIFLQNFNLSFIFLNYSLAKVRPFSKFIFSFFMFFELKLQRFHLLKHFFVLKSKLFNMLRLIIQFTRKLNVLFDSKLGCPLQLILILRKHINFDFPYIYKHFFPQFIDFIVFLFFYCE